jgi:lactoylglutathione lyase
MHIDHIAIWTTDLERLKHFYARFFGATAGDKYVNARRGFESYFLTFDSGARLELMHIAGLPAAQRDHTAPVAGYAHLAIALGSTARVDALTAELRAAGFIVLGEPRWTGDGYYESVILDPDGNQLELTV